MSACTTFISEYIKISCQNILTRRMQDPTNFVLQPANTKQQKLINFSAYITKDYAKRFQNAN